VTIVNDIHLNLEIGQVLPREGIRRQSSVRPEVINLIDELLVLVNDEHLLEPVCAYKIYQISAIDHDQVSLTGNMALHSSLLASALSDVGELVVAVCTIGPKLEKQVTKYLDGNEPLRGLLLDGIGSAAVDSLTQEVCKLIQDEALSRSYQTSSPYSPGHPGFPITEQWPLFQLVPTGEIGVSLAASALMVPRKSVSMVIALGEQVSVHKRGEVCTHCNLNKTCHYRIVAS
jgi:hypothetical protein